MHELGMCEAIVDAALRRADGRRLRAVRVRIGGHAVDPAVVTQNFQFAATGTLAEDADLDLVLEPMSLLCRDCGRESPVLDHLAMVACPRCAGLDIELSGTDNVVLESITVDLPEQSATSPTSTAQEV